MSRSKVVAASLAVAEEAACPSCSASSQMEVREELMEPLANSIDVASLTLAEHLSSWIFVTEIFVSLVHVTVF